MTQETDVTNVSAHERACTIDGCSKPVKYRGLCSMHNARLERHGDPLATYWDRFNRYELTEIGTPRLIMISRDGLTETAVLFDAADEGIVRARHWHLSRNGYVISFSRTNGHRHAVWLHREVLGLSVGDGCVVDHINGIKTDNRHHNLRVVPSQINCSNREIVNNVGTSRFRGVSWDKSSQKWAANVKVNYRKRTLGKFPTEEAAAEAVARFRRENGLPAGY